MNVAHPALRADNSHEWLIEKDGYISKEFAELERERLWPRVWQIACRDEDLPRVGSYHVYDILDDSIIVIRTAEDEIKAYNNACMHRGRRLLAGSGTAAQLACPFHGWKWTIGGKCKYIHDEAEWAGQLTRGELDLPEYRVGRWGGFIFINMDPECEPLEKFLGSVPEYLDCLEFEKLRYRWYVSVEVEANWKTCQEAFAEAYHVQGTHPQMGVTYDDRGYGHAHGKHARLVQAPFMEQIPGFHTGGVKDVREAIIEFIRLCARDIRSIWTERDLQAVSRLRWEVPETATYQEAMAKAVEYIKEAAIASGVGYPDATPQQIADAGFDWLIFPNTINVLSTTCPLWYRTLPSRDNDPNRCIFEMYSLERMVPGSEPKVERLHFKDWRDFKDLPPFLIDDFKNIPEVQRGLRTRGFKTVRTNPVQEVTISNMHRVLREYLES